uniref:Putative methyltransferase n=1 Tax=viral metagenome TaxID=1070528 RepID=A0A6M3KV42_9ZZZZ
MLDHIKRFDEFYSKKQGRFWLDGVDDYWTKKAYNDRNKRICEIVDGIKSQSILDIGCGTGDLVMMLKGDSRMIVGVEPSGVNATKFKDNTGVPVSMCMAEMLLIPNSIITMPKKTFDVAIMADVIEHVVDAPKAVQEALRVIKVNGYLIITTPNKSAEILWGFGSKRMFVKSKVKDSLFTRKSLAKVINKASMPYCSGYIAGKLSTLTSHTIEGIYPRSRILSWLFNPKSNAMMSILRWLGSFEFLRYRQYVIIRKAR